MFRTSIQTKIRILDVSHVPLMRGETVSAILLFDLVERKNNAFSFLNISCTSNGILLLALVQAELYRRLTGPVNNFRIET